MFFGFGVFRRQCSSVWVFVSAAFVGKCFSMLGLSVILFCGLVVGWCFAAAAAAAAGPSLKNSTYWWERVVFGARKNKKPSTYAALLMEMDICIWLVVEPPLWKRRSSSTNHPKYFWENKKGLKLWNHQPNPTKSNQIQPNPTRSNQPLSLLLRLWPPIQHELQGMRGPVHKLLLAIAR